MNGSLPRFALRASLFLAVCASASALVPASQLSFSLNDLRALNYPVGTDVASTVVHANLDGDFREDVIVLRGGDLAIFFAAGDFEATQAVSVPQGATALAVMPGQASNGTDLLVTVGPAGVLSWEFNLDTDQLDSTILPLDGWSNVRHVTVGDVDKDGTATDLAGINAGGYSIRVALDLTGTPINYPSVPSAEKIFDLEFVEAYQGVEDMRELAMLRESSLWVLGLNGEQSSTVLDTVSGGSLAVLGVGESGNERLAIASRGIYTGAYDLFVMESGIAEASVSLGTFNLVGMAAGDVNQDQLPDLVFSSDDGDTVMVLTANGAGPTTFSSPVYPDDFVMTGGGDPGSRGSVCLADLDGDEELDLIHPRIRAGENKLLVFENLVPFGNSPGTIHFSNQQMTQSTTAWKYNETVTLNLPMSAKYNAVEIFVWRHTWGGEGVYDGIDNIATRYDLIDAATELMSGGTLDVAYTLDETMNGEYPKYIAGDPIVEVDHDPNYLAPGDVFILEARPVLKVSGVVAEAGVSVFYAHMNLHENSDANHFLGQYWPGEFFYADGSWTAENAPVASGLDDDQAQFLLDLDSVIQAQAPGYSIRELPPGDTPLPGPPGPKPGGRPKVTNQTQGNLGNEIPPTGA